MNYIEIGFDALFVIALGVMGLILLIKSRSFAELLMGIAAAVLWLGSALHLGMRAFSLLSPTLDYSWFGFSRFAVAAAMTVYQLLLFMIWKRVYQRRTRLTLNVFVWLLVGARIILLFFPQNNWSVDKYVLDWAVFRNIPYFILAGLNVYLWFNRKHKLKVFSPVWLLLLFELLFTLPFAVGFGLESRLYLLMLPAALIQLAVTAVFLNAVIKPVEELETRH